MFEAIDEILKSDNVTSSQLSILISGLEDSLDQTINLALKIKSKINELKDRQLNVGY